MVANQGRSAPRFFHPPRSRELRKGRYPEPERIYLVTTTTLNRTPVFSDFYRARCLIKVLREHCTRDLADTLAFVVMPDHLHWLMQLGSLRLLEQVVGSVKSLCAHQIGHPVWQPGFHDHAIRREEDLLGIARYIVANPLRAGLVERLGDYPHWDAVWF